MKLTRNLIALVLFTLLIAPLAVAADPIDIPSLPDPTASTETSSDTTTAAPANSTTNSNNPCPDSTKNPTDKTGISHFNVFEIYSVDAPEGSDNGPCERVAQNIVADAAARGVSPIEALLLKVINILALLLGSFAMMTFILGGLLWITANGDESKIERGKTILSQTILGTVLALLSYTIVSFVISFFY